MLQPTLSFKGEKKPFFDDFDWDWRIAAIFGLVAAPFVASELESRLKVVSALPEKAVQELQQILGERLSFDEGELEQHGKDQSWHETHAPAAVAYPASTEEVSKIVKVCAKYRIPVVPYGSGTSLEGHTMALAGGLCIDMSNMKKVIKLYEDDMDVVVQPGIGWQELNEYLAPHGFFFPMDPGPGASIGGMVGTSCSGTNAVRYGTMKQNVVNLTVVLPSGEIIKTAQRARKSSAGYDLTRLFIGSEGTLGLVTEATLKLQRIPAMSSVAVANFNSVEDASKCVIQIMQRGCQVGKVELLDSAMVQAVNIHANLSLPLKPHLFFEFSGNPKAVEEIIGIVKDLAKKHGGSDLAWTKTPEEKHNMWRARKEAFWAAGALKPGAEVWTTDVCVPISRLAECIRQTAEDLSQTFLPAPLVGHVGDGNFHLFVLLDPANEKELAEAKRINGRLVQRAIAMEGTCTGEHGIGFGKKDYLEKELGAGSVQLMRTIKHAIDPLGIMNPGKILPDSSHHHAHGRGNHHNSHHH